MKREKLYKALYEDRVIQKTLSIIEDVLHKCRTKDERPPDVEIRTALQLLRGLRRYD